MTVLTAQQLRLLITHNKCINKYPMNKNYFFLTIFFQTQNNHFFQNKEKHSVYISRNKTIPLLPPPIIPLYMQPMLHIINRRASVHCCKLLVHRETTVLCCWNSPIKDQPYTSTSHKR